ncbi:MAG: hypothetical protein KDB26_02995 [Microthrixaceae bacterium]|nr:hypothetical protein [Microthrixaceae bacterium]
MSDPGIKLAYPLVSNADVRNGGAMSSKALDQLSDLLGAELPNGLDSLVDSDAAKLVELIQGAIESQQAEVERAEKDLIRNIPAPFRGPVKRILR